MTTYHYAIPATHPNGAATPLAMTFILDGPDATTIADRLTTAFRDSAALGPDDEPAGPAVVIDTAARQVRIDARPVTVTRREFDLLEHLVRHPGIAFTRRQLLEAAWGHTFSGDRTVDVHIRRLRAKLGPHSGPITTIHGYGYRFEPSPRFAIASGSRPPPSGS